MNEVASDKAGAAGHNDCHGACVFSLLVRILDFWQCPAMLPPSG